MLVLLAIYGVIAVIIFSVYFSMFIFCRWILFGWREIGIILGWPIVIPAWVYRENKRRRLE